MPLSRARTFDELYERTRSHSLVVTPEPSLSDALSIRVEEPTLGDVAVTPRRLAARRREPREDRTAFQAVVAETDLEWPTASYAIGNVLQCWEHECEPDAVLEYPRFDDATHRTVVDLLAGMDTTSRALSEYRLDPREYDDDIAVVAPDLLTPLERSILPGEYTVIDPFHEDTTELAAFRIFESSAAIVDAVLNVVETDNADDVAVVLDGSGKYSNLVESAFEAAAVPFYGGPDFLDRNHHRAFLQLLRLLHAGGGVRIGDVRPLFAELDVELSVEHDQKRLAAVTDLGLTWLQALRRAPEEQTVADVIDTLGRRTSGSMIDLESELDELGVLNRPLTESLVDQLLFYLERYDVPVERDNEGVLLADATNAAYVDRPLVFYLGLDESWTHHSPRRPWVDPDVEYDRHLQQFQLLLQNGQEQYYLVEDTRGGEPVSPTIYFEDLIDDDVERFSDLDHVRHSRRSHDVGDGFERDEREIDVEGIEAISQSALNSYVNSPRDYFFGELLDTPDQDYFEEGSWFHDFAEVYATHPESVSESDIETVVDAMEAAVGPFIDGSDRELRRTTYRIGLEQISRYLDAYPPAVSDEEPAWKPYDDNAVADLLGLETDGPHTEVWFRDTDIGIKGSIDLVRTPEELIDYKKGSHKRPKTVVSNSAIDPPGDAPTFQAIMYLARQRRQHSGTPIAFTFCHFLETLDEQVTKSGTSLEECLSTIEYRPTTFHEHLQKRAVFDYLRAEHYNDCNATFEAVPYDRYRETLSRLDPPDTTDGDELIESPFGQAFIEEIVAAVATVAAEPDGIDAQKGATQALKHFAGINAETYFEPDMAAFESFVEEILNELNDRRRGDERFPVTDRTDEPNERRLDHRDKLLEGV